MVNRPIGYKEYAGICYFRYVGYCYWSLPVMRSSQLHTIDEYVVDLEERIEELGSNQQCFHHLLALRYSLTRINYTNNLLWCRVIPQHYYA